MVKVNVFKTEGSNAVSCVCSSMQSWMYTCFDAMFKILKTGLLSAAVVLYCFYYKTSTLVCIRIFVYYACHKRKRVKWSIYLAYNRNILWFEYRRNIYQYPSKCANVSMLSLRTTFQICNVKTQLNKVFNDNIWLLLLFMNTQFLFLNVKKN